MGENILGMVWHFDHQAQFQSHKFAPRALDIVSEQDFDGLTTSKSRLVGAAVQFIVPSGYVGRREAEVEEALQREGVDVQSSEIHTVTGKELFVSFPYADFVDYQEYRNTDFGTTAKFSIPERIVDSIDKACEDYDEYSLKQKARFVSNCIIAFDASYFSSVFERLETKEQLLKAARGETVEEPTEAFQNIRDGLWFDDLRKQVFVDDKEVSTEDGTLDLAQIDPSDNVTLPDDHPCIQDGKPFDEIGLNQGQRYGAFMAYLRAKMPEGGLAKKAIVRYFELMNTDYSAPEKAVENNVLDHLYEGPDGNYYTSEEDVPSEAVESENVAEERSVLADALIALSKQSQRGLSAAIRSANFEQIDEIPAKEVRDPDRQTLITYLTADELRSALTYVVTSMDREKQKAVIRNETDMEWNDFIFYFEK